MSRKSRTSVALTFLCPFSNVYHLQQYANDIHYPLLSQVLSRFEGRRSEIEINQMMTDIFLEASQGTDHVKCAFKLLLPVLQYRFLRESQES